MIKDLIQRLAGRGIHASITVVQKEEPAPKEKLRRVRLTFVSMASGFLVVTQEGNVSKYTSHPDIRYATPFLERKEADKHGSRAAPMLHGFAKSYYALIQPA